MANKPMINVVATQCQPGDAERFDKWYNEVHVPMILKFKGVKSVSRYKALVKGKPAFLAIYKFDSQKDFKDFEKSPELAAALKEMGESWGPEIELTSRVQYELIKEW